MSEMRFEDQTDEFGKPPAASGGFDLGGRLVKWGVASSRQQAEYILITVAVVAIGIAVFVYTNSSGSSNVPTTPNYGNAAY